jgi:AcrR family transcriptional regulator
LNVHSINPSPRRGRPVVDDKRRRILDAALAMFAQRGYHGTSVPDVAAAAAVSTGTLYHYFEHKEQLVNEVYRDAKLRLRAALLDELPEPRIQVPGGAEAWFLEVWGRLVSFACREPAAIRFLEMQDHVEYLDAESRAVEVSVVAPLFEIAKRIHDLAGGQRVDVTIATIWGAFIGLVKANRLGYLRLDEAQLRTAGTTVWRLLAPEAERAATERTPRGRRRR